MGGGLMQLVAYGAQDIYLTGNPQITFFKVVYRRHTNFSMEAIKQTFSGTAGFGNDVTATISRNGDLVYRMYLEHNCLFSAGTVGTHKDVGLVEHYGHSLIKECEIEIGGQRIDKHTSMWNRVYSDLTEYNPSAYFGGHVLPAAADEGFVYTGTLYQLMTGNGLGMNSDGAGADNDFGNPGVFPLNGFTRLQGGSEAGHINVNKIFLPLNFWFCRNPGLALPLIALQYHEVKVKMTFEDLNKLVRTAKDGDNFESPDPATIAAGSLAEPAPNFDLWCDYIYLDTDERRRFAQVSHEYLIEQLQISENTINSSTPSIDLNFNHPVKELIWTTRNETAGAVSAGEQGGGRCQPIQAAASDGGVGDPYASPVSLDAMGGNWQLRLNGHDRFKERDTKYFTRTQVWQHHTGYGSVPTYGIKINSGDLDLESTGKLQMGGDSIAVYSFALKPEEHQPSGTCNFSRIDNAQLVGDALTIFGVNGGGTPTQQQQSVGTADISDNVKLTIFAVNYNVLRIMSGMGGLAYSN